MKIKTYVDHHCDAEARYTAEVSVPQDYLSEFTDRSVTEVCISVFAPTRALAAAALRAGLLKLSNDLKDAK
jgi:hypothetical protein